MRSRRVVALLVGSLCWGVGAFAAEAAQAAQAAEVEELPSEGRHAWTVSDAEFAAKRSAIVRSFTVPITASGTLTLDLRSTQVDPLIRVLAADGSQRALDDDSGIEWNAHLELQVEAGETLHLEGISQAPHGGTLELELRHGAHPLPSGTALVEDTARFRLARGEYQVLVGFAMRGAKEMHFAGEAFRNLRLTGLRERAYTQVLAALDDVPAGEPERELLEAVARLNLSTTALTLHGRAAAQEHFERAAALADRLGNPEALALMVQSQRATLLKREPGTTAEQLEQAHAALSAAHLERGDTLNAAWAQIDLIDSLTHRGLLVDAERWLRLTRPLVEGLDEPKVGVDLLLAEIRWARAGGDFETAGQLAEQALTRAVVDKQRAEALIFRGDFEISCGRYGDAIECFEVARELADALPAPVLHSAALQRIACVALELDDIVPAMALLRDSLKSPHEDSYDPETVERTLQLVYALLRTDRIDEAEALLEVVARSDAGGEHPALPMLFADARADLAHFRGDLREEREQLAFALASARELALTSHVAHLLAQQAALVREAGDAAQARTLASESVELAGASGQPTTLTDALVELGRAALACGDVPGASRSFRRAEDLLLEQWGGVLSERWGERLRAAERSERLARLGQDLAAAQIAEAGPGTPAWRAALAEGLRRADRWKGRDLLSQRLASYGDTLLVDDLTGEVERQFGARGLDLLHFAEGNEQLYAYGFVGGAWRHVTLGALPEIGEEVLEYLGHVALPSSLGSVAEVASSGSRLHARLLAPLGLGEPSRDLVVVDSGVLAGLPVESLVSHAPAGATRFADLRFVLDDRRVSYAPSASALVIPAPDRPHARSSELVVVADPAFASEAPALPSGPRARGARRVFPRLPGTRGEALAIARTYLSKLRSATEIDELLSEFDSGSRRLDTSGLHLRLGEEATREALLEVVENAAIVHLATHGVQDPLEPRRSALALAPSLGGEGALYLGEILDWRLQADLAVLSACETASGTVRHGEGTRSLAWSFLRAGAASVVATLWQVDDRESEALMSAFYAEYLADRDAPVALQDARLALRNASAESGAFVGVGRGKRLGPRPAPENDPALAGHPFFWASFVHMRAHLDAPRGTSLAR